MSEPRKALVIGIDRYPFYPLHACVADAVKISNLLARHENRKPNFEVKTLLSSTTEITKSTLRKEINDLFSGHPSIALLYFAGHGTITPYGGLLVTPDYERYDEGVSMDDIMKLANSSKARDKVIILDCCNAANIASASTSGTATSQLCDGLTILASSGYVEPSEEQQSSIFSSLLIDALAGQCADLTGNILPSNIYAYIDRALGQWEKQHPIFKTNVSRFISLREVEPPIPFPILRKLTEYFPSPEYHHQLDSSHEFTSPDANPDNVPILKNLQKLQSVGLVRPVDEEHMYYTAINEKPCELTTLGKRYWSLIHSNRI